MTRADKIINGIIKSDHPKNIRNDLNKIWISYLINEEVGRDERLAMNYSYQIIESALLEMEDMANSSKTT